MGASIAESRNFLLADHDENMLGLLTAFVVFAGHHVVRSSATLDESAEAIRQAADPDDELKIDYIIADSTSETQELIKLNRGYALNAKVIAFSSYHLQGADYQVRRPHWEQLNELLQKLGEVSNSTLAS